MIEDIYLYMNWNQNKTVAGKDHMLICETGIENEIEIWSYTYIWTWNQRKQRYDRIHVYESRTKANRDMIIYIYIYIYVSRIKQNKEWNLTKTQGWNENSKIIKMKAQQKHINGTLKLKS